jgi:hypothetical protein
MRTTLLLLGCLAFGCKPAIRINWSRPPRFSFSQATPVALVAQPDGTAPSAGDVLDTIHGVTQGSVLNKWAAVPIVQNEFSSELGRAGYRVVDPRGAALILYVRPVGWHYALEQQNNFQQGVGRLDVVDPQHPDAPVFIETYWGRAVAQELAEPESMVRAAQLAVGAFLRDMLPRRVSSRVVLDNSDPITRPGIALCKLGQFDAAYDAFADAVARAPNSPPANYDLAVLAEARGEYDKSEQLLVHATQLNPKPLYFTALERTRTMRRDAQAMAGN